MTYTGPVTDPFRLTGTDGRTYFDILGVPIGMVQLYNDVVAVIEAAEAQVARATDPAIKTYWERTAVRLSKAAVDYRDAVIRIAEDTARVATTSAREQLDATQVRPSTSNGLHLRDVIQSRPLGPRPELGAVGVGDIEILDSATGPDGNPYWTAQEFGSSQNIGRIVPGYFMPGRARPSAAEFRVHPEFDAVLYTRGTPPMVITKPIPERGFLRHAVEAAGLYRHRRLEAPKRKLIAEMDRVGRGAPVGRGRRP